LSAVAVVAVAAVALLMLFMALLVAVAVAAGPILERVVVADQQVMALRLAVLRVWTVIVQQEVLVGLVERNLFTVARVVTGATVLLEMRELVVQEVTLLTLVVVLVVPQVMQ
jgi:hypothetical protein